jgi:hypothetical protein
MAFSSLPRMAFFLNRFSGAFSLWGMAFSSLFSPSFFLAVLILGAPFLN